MECWGKSKDWWRDEPIFINSSRCFVGTISFTVVNTFIGFWCRICSKWHITPWNYYVNQHSTWCQRWHAKAADFKDSISQSNSPFSDSRNGAKNKLNHTVFTDNYVFLLKIGRFLELLLSMDPAKNDIFLCSGQKIIILTQIIMLIWFSGYMVYTYK